MSLILDALRRAESERRSGEAPGIHELPAAEAAPRHGLHPAWLAVAAAAAFLLAMLLWPRTPPSRTEPVAAVTPAPAAVPAASALPERAPAPTRPVVSRPSVRSLDDLMPAPPEPAAPPADEARKPAAVTRPARAAPTADTPPPASAAPADTPVDAPRATPAELASPAAPTGDAGIETRPTQLPPDMLIEGPSVTPLVDMPADYRSDFPRIRVDVHVYDEEPARRFVLLNLKRYREGDRTAEGLQISEIQPRAIVFSYRGERVLYQLQR